MGRTVGELLSTYAEILAELRERGVVRSANAPAGDYAEWLCSRALGGALVDNFSVKSHDLVLADGQRVQVRTRVTSEPSKAGQLPTSPYRSWDFDLAAFVLLRDYDYAVRRAVLVPVDVVRAKSSYRSHVNGSVVMMRGALLDHVDAEDITDRLRAAASEG
ncbi:MAG: hypothetical protein L0Z47_01100 [Actinobacteria bacterium]|nr:hypothetical protein [Actinomycetota bacterium]